MATLSPTNNDAGNTRAAHMPALTGVRFFAIFHIFLHHLWANYYYVSGTSEATQGLLIGLKDAPDWVMTFMANGWVSTSLFFLLSGFILSFLYWGEDGSMLISKKRFWILRFARIYPIHIAVVVILVLLKFQNSMEENASMGALISSAFGTAALIQAWFPPWIPMWNWPSWTISVMVFLYLIMPCLIKLLSRLSHRQLVITLVAMPFLSLLPTAAYTVLLKLGVPWNMTFEMFFSHFPLFWIPYFVAGMVMTRIFSLNRTQDKQQSTVLFAWGDLAFLLVIAISLIPNLEQPYVFVFRQGLLMPLYMVFLLDLARGKGLIARLFSLPGTHFLGKIGFSMFIWQAVIFAGLFISLSVFPASAPYQVWLAIAAIFILAIPSTYLVEKPLVKLIRRKYL